MKRRSWLETSRTWAELPLSFGLLWVILLNLLTCCPPVDLKQGVYVDNTMIVYSVYRRVMNARWLLRVQTQTSIPSPCLTKRTKQRTRRKSSAFCPGNTLGLLTDHASTSTSHQVDVIDSRVSQSSHSKRHTNNADIQIGAFPPPFTALQHHQSSFAINIHAQALPLT
jgi:hypothetical protein